jgi:hypothetical protein
MNFPTHHRYVILSAAKNDMLGMMVKNARCAYRHLKFDVERNTNNAG